LTQTVENLESSWNEQMEEAREDAKKLNEEIHRSNLALFELIQIINDME